jgi:hypothetical protein
MRAELRRIRGVEMSEQIRAVGAIGGVTGSNAVDWYNQYQPYARATGQTEAAPQRSGMREGAPADVVELSMEPETIRELPASMYLKFLVDKADGRIIIQVIDAQTDEIVRVVPPAKLQETLRGLGS